MDEIKSGLMSYSSSGRVAQLDRALASEAKGRGFESRLAHQCQESLWEDDQPSWNFCLCRSRDGLYLFALAAMNISSV